MIFSAKIPHNLYLLTLVRRSSSITWRIFWA